jgi:hypothetical protein
MTDPAQPGSATAPDGGKAEAKAGFQLVVGKATDAFRPWQQIPAWVLGLAAIIGAGFLIAFPRHLTDTQTRDAWTAVIVALFLAVLLSFRSAFTLNDKDGAGAADAGGADAGGKEAGADKPPAAGGQ